MDAGEPVYHLELKAFPHVARVFNLDRPTLDERFLAPWTAGELIEHDDRRWPPDKTRLTVILGPRLEAGGRGLGRGWGEVTRHGRDVTDAVLTEIHRGADSRPEVEALQAALDEVAGGPDGVGFPDAIALAAAAHPGWRASEQLSLAEQAVWEMLHRERLALVDGDGVPVAVDRWQAVLLAWSTWAGGDGAPGGRGLRLRALGGAPPAGA